MGRDVDDTPAALLDHDGRDRLAGDERGAQVDGHVQVPLPQRSFAGRERSRRCPALFTSTSTAPNSSSARWTISRMLSSSRTLQVTARGLPAHRLNFRYRLVNGAGQRPSRFGSPGRHHHRGPASASPSAIALPMPRLAPVTMAILPCKDWSVIHHLSCSGYDGILSDASGEVKQLSESGFTGL